MNLSRSLPDNIKLYFNLLALEIILTNTESAILSSVMPIYQKELNYDLKLK